MEEEIKRLKEEITDETVTTIANQTFYDGVLHNKPVTVVRSGIGKVNASIATTLLIQEFKVDAVINTGSAGGIGEGLHVGDIVISTETAYHDVDATAFNYRYGQLPGKEPRFKASDQWGQALEKAGEKTGLNVKRGLIVSGDQFIASSEAIKEILNNFPDALSSEMEGAAVGQVATDHQIPYVVVRAMSDTGDEDAGVSFDDFIIDAGKRSANMLLQLFADLDK